MVAALEEGPLLPGVGKVDVDAAGAGDLNQPFGQAVVGLIDAVLGQCLFVYFNAQARGFGHLGVAAEDLDPLFEQAVLVQLVAGDGWPLGLD